MRLYEIAAAIFPEKQKAAFKNWLRSLTDKEISPLMAALDSITLGDSTSRAPPWTIEVNGGKLTVRHDDGFVSPLVLVGDEWPRFYSLVINLRHPHTQSKGLAEKVLTSYAA